jgi:hypothetical protein
MQQRCYRANKGDFLRLPYTHLIVCQGVGLRPNLAVLAVFSRRYDIIPPTMAKPESLRPKHTPKERVEHNRAAETLPDSKQLYAPKPDPDKRAKEAVIKALRLTKIGW